MDKIAEYNKIYINRQRTKNRKIWSNYLYMLNKNQNMEKALITFTSPKIEASNKLEDIRLIKKYFSKLISNLKIDISKFVVIELGKNKNNPHVHIQLFYNLKDLNKIQRVYSKTLSNFNLHDNLCKFTTVDKNQTYIKYFSYILKEYSNRLSDSELIELMKARTNIKGNKNKNMQFISSSHHLLTRPIYKHLFYKFNITYANADFLSNADFLQVVKCKKKKYFKISWRIKKIVSVLCFIIFSLKTTQIRQKIQYNNKSKKLVTCDVFYTVFYCKFGFT